MITETRQSRTSLLHCYESHPRRRHHTLDNTTLDKFNFICVPLHLDKTRIHSLSSSQSNLIITSSNQFSIPKLIGLASPTRRVRFKFDENQHTHSSDDVRLPKRYSIHRVEFQIPIYKDTNSYSNINCSSTPAKTRSITSQKIDINHNNTMHPQGITSSTDSSTLSTVDSDKTKTEWYKDMYGRLHKSSETKKDVILVKLPPTPSRYREYYQQRDEQQNPYKPTYTFPEEFDGNLERMEDYIRKVASVDIDDDDTKHSSSSTTNVKNHQTISKRTHFDDRLSSPITSSSTERTKSNNDASASSRTINSKSNPTHIRTPSSTTDDEQKLIYKRILRGGEIPATGLQKFSVNNRVSSSSIQRPLILTNHPQLSPTLFAYYSVYWEQNQSNNQIDNDMHFEINSCLYFQNNNNNDDENDDEWEQIREDGCGYVITYPPHIHPTDDLQIYNFDRTKSVLLTSTDVYLKSKKYYNYSINKNRNPRLNFI